eukprot:1716042-Pyramimonas_sp.AAC.1
MGDPWLGEEACRGQDAHAMRHRGDEHPVSDALPNKGPFLHLREDSAPCDGRPSLAQKKS